MKRKLLIIGIWSMGAAANAFAPTNFFRPYDSAIRLTHVKDTTFSLGARVEYGDSKTGRNFDDKRRNVLALYDDTQSFIPMLINPNADVEAKTANTLTALTAAFVGIPVADGRRGEIDFSGNFTEIDATLCGSYKLPFTRVGDLTLSLHVPVINKKIDSFVATDLTPSILAGDYAIQALIADLGTNLKSFGDLDISPVNQTGLGDILLMLDGKRVFYQDKEILRKVILMAKLGLSIPSGKEKNEDKALSMAFGNDGAWGLPLGVGMTLGFKGDIKFGIDIDFMVLFDKTRSRRMKTNVHQTEFLLLNKGDATKEYGLTWQFHLFLQAYHFAGGLSAKTAYQFVKHDDDRLSPQGNDFSFSVVNTARSLKEWTAHNMIFSLHYDFFCHHHHEHDHCDQSFVPQLNFFYKLAIGGKNIIDNNSIGGQLAVNF